MTSPSSIAALSKPTFLIIGASKCGSSSLNAHIGEHPEVCMSTPKELHHFDVRRNYDEGMQSYWQRGFSSWNGEKAAGEATPDYLLLPFAARRIAECLPEVKLLAILRNPVDRAYSAWWMWWTRRKDRLPFEKAIAQNLERLQKGPLLDSEAGETLWNDHLSQDNMRVRPYVEAGYYAEQLRLYMQLFGADRIKVVLFEDLQRDPLGVTQEAWRFIGVTPLCSLEDADARNVAMGGYATFLFRVAEAFGTRRLIYRIPYSLRRPIKRIVSSFGKRPGMPQALRSELVEHYRPHNEDLQNLIDRDLSSWLE